MREHLYKTYTDEMLNDLFSHFLMDSWSYSKVTSFARHEKAFEMQYIFGLYSRSSATTIAGQAYHHSLAYFFNTLKDTGEKLDIVSLEQAAFEFIGDIPANRWKIQKTTPTMDDCVQKALKTVSALLLNFLKESDVYLDDLAEIIGVEIRCEEFVTINGVDIPLPCHAFIDLVIKTKEGKTVIIDHKSKNAFTSDEEIALSIGEQAATYLNCFEAQTGITADEVCFVENKFSQNKNGASQLNAFKVSINDNTRKLYEALLYEPLKRMLEAINNPDYIYLINQSDNFVDKAELYDFWARTQISEVDDFNVEESKKELVSKRLRKIKDSSIEMISPEVIKKFKQNASSFIKYDMSSTDMTQQQKIEHTLKSFGTVVNVAHTFEGYSCNTHLMEISAGVSVSSIYSKRLDLANALDVANVRLSQEMVVYEGRSYLSVDFPKKRDRDLFWDKKYLEDLKIPLGIDNFGNVIFWDLNNHSTPHALMCGATGSGKSVSIQSTIEFAKAAGIKDIVIFDPKYEFTDYNGQNINVINDIEDIEVYMALLVEQMNGLVKFGRKQMTLVVFDEFADAVAQSRKGKELGSDKSLEENLRILLQKGRSSGFRILAATQRASVKVITGDAKVNFPVQICFRVPKEIDSKVVLDEPGAETLAGKGDGLMKSPEYFGTQRFQAFYYEPAKMNIQETEPA